MGMNCTLRVHCGGYQCACGAIPYCHLPCAREAQGKAAEHGNVRRAVNCAAARKLLSVPLYARRNDISGLSVEDVCRLVGNDEVELVAHTGRMVRIDL